MGFFWNEYRGFPDLIKHEILRKNEGHRGRYIGKPWLLTSVNILHVPRRKIFDAYIFQVYAVAFCNGLSKKFCYKNMIPKYHQLLLKLLEMCLGKLNKYAKFNVILLSFEKWGITFVQYMFTGVT